MKKLFSVFFLCCFFVLILFFLFGGYEEQLTLLLESRKNQNIYWIVSFAVLSSDIFIPVPSSVVMVLNGKVLGFFFGMLLSTTSGLVSSAIGFYLGRKSESFIDRFFSEKQQKVSSDLFQKYGLAAITLSKALPIISEAVSFLSGTTAISFRKFLWYSFIGHLIISAVYAYAGSFSSSIDSNLLSGGIIIAVLGLFYVIDRLINKKVLREE